MLELGGVYPEEGADEGGPNDEGEGLDGEPGQAREAIG